MYNYNLPALLCFLFLKNEFELNPKQKINISVKKMYFKMSAARLLPFCLGCGVLKYQNDIAIAIAQVSMIRNAFYTN